MCRLSHCVPQVLHCTSVHVCYVGELFILLFFFFLFLPVLFFLTKVKARNFFIAIIFGTEACLCVPLNTKKFLSCTQSDC